MTKACTHTWRISESLDFERRAWHGVCKHCSAERWFPAMEWYKDWREESLTDSAFLGRMAMRERDQYAG